MLTPQIQLLVGILAATGIAVLAYLAHTLSRSGAIAAALLGTIVFGFGGFSWAIVLLGFFVSSSLLSRFLKQRKSKLDEKFSKGSQRDASQVSANGGVAGVCVLLSLLFPQSRLPFFVFAATLAAVNADTWATELGVLSRQAPRLITNGKVVEPGTSGGVTWFGTFASALGAAFIALLAVVVRPDGFGSSGIEGAIIWFAGITLAGVAGSLVDSTLGASLQAIYYCPTCNKETERHPLHSCATPTSLRRGKAWLNNDLVNAACAASGAILALLMGLVFGFTGAFRNTVENPGEKTMTDFPISSTAFQSESSIPERFTCSSENISPDLAWGPLPAGTRSVVLIMDDPDAPVGLFVHWVLYNLTPEVDSLAAGEATPVSTAGTAGTNSYGHNGYDGPCPPPGKAHRYFFTVYATDVEPSMEAGMTAAQVRKKIEGHILAQSSLMGTYQR